MIFQKLHAFAKQRGLLDEMEFVGQTIHGYLPLTAAGALASPPSRLGDKKAPRVLSVARLPARNSAAIAGVGADTLGRVVPGFDPAANPFARQTQQLFLVQMEAVQLAQPAPHAGLSAVAAFLRLLGDADTAAAVSDALRKAKLLPTEWITFQVEGQEDGLLCVEWPAVRAWWQAQQAGQRAARAAAGGAGAFCVVTGQACQPVSAHGTRVKGIPGGRSGGIAMISGDKSAFSSYGFEKSLTSPMSEEAVEGYIRAVGFMVEHTDYRYRTGEVIHLFFGDQPSLAENPGKMIELGGDWSEDPAPRDERSANPAVARGVFTSPRSGLPNTAGAEDAARFYSLSLSGNSARAIVRGWLDQTLREAAQHTREWFEDLEIRLDRPIFKEKELIAERGALHHRWPLWRLVDALQGKGENAKEQIIKEQQQLWDCALAGRAYPMPLNLLLRAVSRIGASGDLPPARAALIRCVLNRQPDRTHPMKKDLDLQSDSRAYHCGRLLRLIANIQREALGDVGAGVVEKHYPAASAMPGNVFGPLIAKSNPHLAKIADDPKRKGLAGWFERSLAEVCTAIVGLGGFPQTNNPVQQGEFALGFYFQATRVPKEAAPVSAEVLTPGA